MQKHMTLNKQKGLVLWQLMAGLLAVALLVSLSYSLFGSKAQGTLPDKFEVSQRTVSFFHTSDIKGPEGSYGNVSKVFWSWAKTFELEDQSGHLQATATSEVFTWGTKIDIKDGKGDQIGAIQKEVGKSALMMMGNSFKILDASGNQIATSEKSQFGSTDIAVRGMNGEQLATLHRGWFNWLGDTWTVTSSAGSPVDKRILIMIAAFKSSADSDESSSDSSSSSSSKSK